MNISNTQNLNFKASFVTSCNVKKTFLRKCSKKTVSFVEFDKKSRSDFKTLNELRERWGESYLDDIGYHLTSIWGRLASIYFLTTQKDKFEELDPSKILGAVSAYPGIYGICIDFLQIDPRQLNNKCRKSSLFYDLLHPKYRYCGTEMINCLKKIYPQKDLTVLPASNTLDFYHKNGFKKENENSSKYIRN